VGGDFKTLAYFDVWLAVAKARPEITFYAYTKSIPFWVKRIGQIPANFIITASIGGKYDALACEYGLRTAQVVDSIEEADQLGLPVDHDDSLAAVPGGNFALLVHGPQPANSIRAKIVRKLIKRGLAYGPSSKRREHAHA
jgi:hypothetical protein